MKALRLITMFTLVACLAGCRTVRVIEQVPVEVHDTMYQKVVQRDSIYTDRWRTVEVKDDTIYVTDSHISVTYRTITDTAYKYIEKPVEVTVEHIKEVEAPLPWWQKGLMWAGVLALATALVALVVHIRRDR